MCSVSSSGYFVERCLLSSLVDGLGMVQRCGLFGCVVCFFSVSGGVCLPANVSDVLFKCLCNFCEFFKQIMV